MEVLYLKNRILNSLIASSILGTTLFSVTPVLADEYDTRIQEAQQQAQENEQAADSLNSVIRQLTSDVENTQAALANLNAEIAKNESSLKTTLENLQQSTQEMEKLLEEIAVLEKNIEARTEKLEEQARTVQVSGNPTNYIEFILDAKSLTDIIARIDIVANLVTSSNTMIEDQVRDQQAVEEKRDETERKINQQNALVEELEATSANLEVQKVSQTALVAQLELEKSNVASEREALLAKRNEALQLVSDIENEREAVRLAAEQAERERAEREEQERIAQEKAEEERAKAVARGEENNQSEAQASRVAPTSSSRESAESTASNSSTPRANSSSNNSSSTENSAPAAEKKQEKAEPKPQPKPKPAPAPSGNVLSIASQYLYVNKYTWGGTTPSGGFDCSGFTQFVFAKAGKSIPRTSGAQYSSATKVSNPQPGDLVFFSGNGSSITHVGIYTGNGQFIGSQNSTGVAYASATTGYWGARLVGYGRY